MTASLNDAVKYCYMQLSSALLHNVLIDDTM